MIDQIIYEIPFEDFKVLDGRSFEPIFIPNYPKTFRYKKYICISRLKEYGPQISIHGRPNVKKGYQFILKVQVSVPKILFGNNLININPDMEDRFYDNLKGLCYQMGVSIPKGFKNARVVGFDPSITIKLTNGATVEQAINSLYLSYASKWISFDKRDFRDKGHAIYLHRGNWNFVVYDKKEDMLKVKYKRVDKDKQGVDWTDLKSGEFLRLELHARNQAKLTKLMRRFYPDILEVQSWMLFNEKINKQILRETLIEEMFKNSKVVLINEDDAYNWYKAISQKYPELSDNKIRAKLALVLLSRDGSGLLRYRRELERTKTSREWYRVLVEVRDLQTININGNYYQFVYDIDQALWYKGCENLL